MQKKLPVTDPAIGVIVFHYFRFQYTQYPFAKLVGRRMVPEFILKFGCVH